MPRIRYMKQEFFLDENLAKTSCEARLLAVGLPCIADKAGRLEDRPLRIKAMIFPYHEVNADALLKELSDVGFIVRYVVDDKQIIQIVNFTAEQRPHPKETESTLPAIKLHGKPRNSRASKPLMGMGNGDLNGDGDRVLPPFHGEEFLAALADYEQHRKEKRDPLKPTSRKLLYRKFELWGERDSTAAMLESIQNGWTGVFVKNGNGHVIPSKSDRTQQAVENLIAKHEREQS